MPTTSEYNSNNAFIYNGNNGNVNNNNKYNTNTVRPVSDFSINEDSPYIRFMESMYQALRLCLRHKMGSPNTQRFLQNAAANMLSLVRDIWEREYVPAPSISFIIRIPCRREVVAADFRDRIVQHWVVSRLEPLFEKCGVIDRDVYSCRVGKGNLAALQNARDKIYRATAGYKEDAWVCKFDLSSYFMRIDKRLLYDELIKLVQEKYEGEDKDTLLYLIRVVTFHNPQDGAVRKSPLSEWAELEHGKSLYDLEWFQGLAIGNLESQIDANFYNVPLMRWLRSVGLDPTNYVDDFFVVDRDKEKILGAMSLLRPWLESERGLKLHPRKFYIQHSSKSIAFLGGVIKHGILYINNRTVRRLRQKIYYYNTFLGDTARHRRKYVERFACILNSYFGTMKYYASWNIRTKIAASVTEIWGRDLVFNEDFTKISLIDIRNSLKRARHHARNQRRSDIHNLNNILYGTATAN